MNNITSIIPIFLFLFVIFIIGREFMAWYFKINRIVMLLEKIEENTRPVVAMQKHAEESLLQK